MSSRGASMCSNASLDRRLRSSVGGQSGQGSPSRRFILRFRNISAIVVKNMSSVVAFLDDCVSVTLWSPVGKDCEDEHPFRGSFVENIFKESLDWISTYKLINLFLSYALMMMQLNISP